MYFPHPSLADSDGILAIGGDLSEERLLLAYQFGIFPWYNPEDPIIWWAPDPRCVLIPSELHVPKSMRSLFNQPKWTLTYDQCFTRVMESCQLIPRNSIISSWIQEPMIEAYSALHRSGWAHSVEVWNGDELVGGLYGVAMGRVFFGESMFSQVPNASKYGFISMVRALESLGYQLIDCQQRTQHLLFLGAKTIPREEFLQVLRSNFKWIDSPAFPK
ncbi:MAG: leucyl/phenylalanyl-tRNA--protein transferase [Saprospiraceae bacterium]